MTFRESKIETLSEVHRVQKPKTLESIVNRPTAKLRHRILLALCGLKDEFEVFQGQKAVASFPLGELCLHPAHVRPPYWNDVTTRLFRCTIEPRSFATPEVRIRAQEAGAGTPVTASHSVTFSPTAAIPEINVLCACSARCHDESYLFYFIGPFIVSETNTFLVEGFQVFLSFSHNNTRHWVATLNTCFLPYEKIPLRE